MRQHCCFNSLLLNGMLSQLTWLWKIVYMLNTECVCVCIYIHIHIFVLNTEFLSAKIYSVTFPLEAHLMLPVFTG